MKTYLNNFSFLAIFTFGYFLAVLAHRVESNIGHIGIILLGTFILYYLNSKFEISRKQK